MPDESERNGVVKLDRRKMIIGLGLLGVAGVVNARLPEPNRSPLEEGELDALMPDQVGQWTFASKSGLVLPPDDALSNRLYDNLVTRLYFNPAGETVMFLMAYNNLQDGVIQIHRPEICYPAGGFDLTPTRDVEVDLPGGSAIPAQGFAALSRTRDETILYWTRVGDEFPRRWSEQRLTVAKENLRGVIPDGMLARVSSIGGEVDREMPKLESFVGELYAVAPPKLRGLLFGSAV